MPRRHYAERHYNTTPDNNIIVVLEGTTAAAMLLVIYQHITTIRLSATLRPAAEKVTSFTATPLPPLTTILPRQAAQAATPAVAVTMLPHAAARRAAANIYYATLPQRHVITVTIISDITRRVGYWRCCAAIHYYCTCR